MEDNFENFGNLTAASLMRSMYKPDYPPHIGRLLAQVRSWLTKNWNVDGETLPYWEVLREESALIWDELSWLEKQVALLPAETPPAPQAEAVVLALGEVDLTDAMRLAADYSLIFSRDVCRRVWIVTDCWIPFDVYEYRDHIQVMTERGITLRFAIVTPWGWIEMPVANLAKAQLPGSSSSDNGNNRRRRREDD